MNPTQIYLEDCDSVASMAYRRERATAVAGPPARKKLKTSDLPLASATRAAIEGLAHTFKKKGGYDSLRKQVWDSLVGSVRLSRSFMREMSC